MYRAAHPLRDVWPTGNQIVLETKTANCEVPNVEATSAYISACPVSLQSCWAFRNVVDARESGSTARH